MTAIYRQAMTVIDDIYTMRKYGEYFYTFIHLPA